MLNRYIDPEGWDRLFGPAAPSAEQSAEPAAPQPGPQKGSAFSALQELLGGRLRDINAETLVLVVLVYFLVADRDEGDDKISDTLLIIGALLLFGL